ncbi:hypothetical protein FDF13_08965 [Brevibacterium sp. CS2]|nr:hypothetical protein FDF13_08965 [Brevibacterium sp. CS2]
MGAAPLPPESALPGMLVDVDWLADHLDDPQVLVVDVTAFLTRTDTGVRAESGADAFRAGHIPGAVFADLVDTFTTSEPVRFTALSSPAFARAAGGLGIDADVDVVVYDHGESEWATRLWWNLRLEGHDQVALLDGGLPAWRAAGHPLGTGDAQPVPRTFTARRRPELLADAAAVEAATAAGVPVVNALDPDAYSGRTRPYGRPGHIPGSTNAFFRELYDEDRDHRLVPAEQARAVLAPTGILDSAAAPIAYCGGGIAATLVAFSAARLGRPDVAVYDGSMTEWVAQGRPLETTPDRPAPPRTLVRPDTRYDPHQHRDRPDTTGGIMYFIVVKFRVKPEAAEAWPEIVRDFTEATRAEPGNLWFDWSRSLEDPHEYVLVEAFADDDAAAAHVGSAHFATMREEFPQRLQSTPRIISRKIEGEGWDAMGELQVD